MAIELLKYFPEHKMRIELFFGAGGSFFQLPKAQYSIVNDLDDEVTNFYLTIQKNPEEFRKQLALVPLSETLLSYWKKNREIDPVKKAIRFIFLSNFTYMGKGDTLRIGLDNAKKTALKNLDNTLLMLQDVKILNRDFRDVLSTISFSKGLNDKDKCFVYLDPIYHETEHYYNVPKWTPADTIDCLEIMVNCGIRSAMSEFNSDFIIDEAIKRNLNIINLKSRANIKNRRTEILITNYEDQRLFKI